MVGRKGTYLDGREVGHQRDDLKKKPEKKQATARPESDLNRSYIPDGLFPSCQLGQWDLDC